MRIALLIAAGSLFAQQDPTIRLDVQQVLVPVVVTDKKGHHVTGLRASDFRVFEDGVPQTIASFSSDTSGSVDDLALMTNHAAKHADAAPAASGPRHTFAICIDTLHTAPANAARMREALENLFEKEKPSDAQYVLIGVGRQMQVLQPATTNPLALLVKLRGPAFQNAMGGLDGSALAADIRNLRGRMDEFCRRCACGPRPSRQTCDSEVDNLKQAVDADAARWTAPTQEMIRQFTSVVGELAKIPTGRTLILVSDGFDVDPKNAFYAAVSAYLPNRPQFKLEETKEIEPALREALKTAAERNIAIYAVDSRGGATPTFAPVDPMDAGRSLGGSGGGLGDMVSNSRRGQTAASAISATAVGAFVPEKDSVSMEQLARATGGVYYRASGDLLKQFRSALADGREYYVLAYVPKNGAQDGKYRHITVEAAGRDVTVRAKEGYWAPGVAQ